MRFLWITAVFVVSARNSDASDWRANVQAIPQLTSEKKNRHLRSRQSAFEENVLEDVAAGQDSDTRTEMPTSTTESKHRRLLPFFSQDPPPLLPAVPQKLLFGLLLIAAFVAGFLLTFDGNAHEQLLYFSFGFIVGMAWSDTLFLDKPKLTDALEEFGFAFTIQGFVIGPALGAAMTFTRKRINSFGAGLTGMLIAQMMWNVFPFGEQGNHHLEHVLRVLWLLLGFAIVAHFFPKISSQAICLLCSIFGGFLLTYCFNIAFGFARGSSLIQGSFIDSFQKIMHLNVGDLRDINQDQSIFFLAWGCIAIFGFLTQMHPDVDDDWDSESDFVPVRHEQLALMDHESVEDITQFCQTQQSWPYPFPVASSPSMSGARIR